MRIIADANIVLSALLWGEKPLLVLQPEWRGIVILAVQQSQERLGG